MSYSLLVLHRKLKTATCPEDVFGHLEGNRLALLKQHYRRFATSVHPDHNLAAVGMANEAFKLLQKWYAIAQRKVRNNSYGLSAQIAIQTKTALYEGFEMPIVGDLCDLFPAASATNEVLLKLVRNPCNNDLMDAENRALSQISAELATDPLRAHFPTILESVFVSNSKNERRRVNILQFEQAFVSLADIVGAYPLGIDSADMAWMFNRLLATMASYHKLGLVHGAIVPEHVLYRLKDHNGMLVDWCYSTRMGETIRAISPTNRGFYPPEVLAQQPATAATDLYMAASCMVKLLGGDPATQQVPATVPRPIVALLRTCLIPSPHRRANDAWEIFDKFGVILRKLYGKPKFRPFKLPEPLSV